MYLRDLLSSLIRRWYFVAFGLVVTVGFCGIAYQSLSPTYEARASAVLLPPPSATTPSSNPLLVLGGLNQALDVLVRSVGSDKTREAIAANNPATSFTIAQDATTTGPILLVVAKGPGPQATLDELHTVLTTVPDSLTSLQESLGVRDKDRIAVMNLAVDSKVTTQTKSRTRAALALAALGVALTLLMSGWLDRVLLRRQSRQAEVTPSKQASTRRQEHTDTDIAAPLPSAVPAGVGARRPGVRRLGRRRPLVDVPNVDLSHEIDLSTDKAEPRARVPN